MLKPTEPAERSEPTPRSRSRQRWAPLTGAAATALWVTAFLVGSAEAPDFNDRAQEWLTYISDNDGRILASRVLFLFGVFSFFWFLTTLRAWLLEVEGAPGRFASLAFAAGVATAVLLIANVVPLLAATFSVAVLEPAAAQALGVVETGFFIGAESTAAVFVAATALLALRDGAFPKWLGWASAILALVLLILPVGWIGLLVGFPLWVVAVSFVLWRSGGVAGVADEVNSQETPG